MHTKSSFHQIFFWALVLFLLNPLAIFSQPTTAFRIGWNNPFLQEKKDFSAALSTSPVFATDRKVTITNSNGFYVGGQIKRPFLKGLNYRTGLNIQFGIHEVTTKNQFTDRLKESTILTESANSSTYKLLHLNLPFVLEKEVKLNTFSLTIGGGIYYNLPIYSQENRKESLTNFLNYQIAFQADCQCNRIIETTLLNPPENITTNYTLRGQYAYQPFGLLGSLTLSKTLSNGTQLGINYRFNQDLTASFETRDAAYTQTVHQVGLSYQFQKRIENSKNKPIRTNERGTFLIGTSWHLYYPSDDYFVSGPTLSLSYFTKNKWGFELIGSLLDEEYDLVNFSGKAVDVNILYALLPNTLFGKIGMTTASEGDGEYNDLEGTAIQIGLGLFQPIGKKIVLRGDLHQRLWIAGYYLPRKFTLGINLGFAYRL